MDKIFKIFFLILVGFVIIGFTALGIDFYKTMKYANGFVWQDKHGTAVKKFIKEENNCIYFIDIWESENKICGSYQLKNYKK